MLIKKRLLVTSVMWLKKDFLLHQYERFLWTHVKCWHLQFSRNSKSEKSAFLDWICGCFFTQWTVKPPLDVPLWQKVVLLLWAGSFGQMRPHETPEVPHSLCNGRKDAISLAAGTNSFNFVLFSLCQQVIKDGSVCLCLAVFTLEPLPDIFSLYNVRITVCVLLSGKCWWSRSSLRWAK